MYGKSGTKFPFAIAEIAANFALDSELGDCQSWRRTSQLPFAALSAEPSAEISSILPNIARH